MKPMERTKDISEALGAVARVFDWIRTHTQSGADISGFSASEIGVLAEDIGLSQADLQQVALHPADNSELMQRMMAALGLDAAALERSDPAVMRDVEATCTRCRETRSCRQDLAAGTPGVHCGEYCPNASTFIELIEACAPQQ
jgi:hypothetical protein